MARSPTYEFQGPNPWDKATWNTRAQIEFVRQTRAQWDFNGSAEIRIAQRIAQSDTNGFPPKSDKPTIIVRNFIHNKIISATTTTASGPEAVTLGFAETGTMMNGAQYPLAISSQVVTFPSATVVSQAGCLITATDYSTLTLEDGDGNILCIVEFAPSRAVGTFDWTSPAFTVPTGTILYIVPDGDPTLADVSIAFIGTAGDTP